jgi:hypothetical protein
MKNQALLLALFFCCISGSAEKKEAQAVRSEFRLPVLVHKTFPKWAGFLHPEYLSEMKSVYIGKFKWTDSLIVSADLFEYRSISGEDQLFQYEDVMDRGYLETDGLQLFPDYASSVAYTPEYSGYGEDDGPMLYYPLYVVNETARNKYYKYDSYRGFPIQEAIEISNNERVHWRPMESTKRIGCGNWEQTIRIRPGEFLLFLLPKYYGDIPTSLRVRMKNGPNILVSDAFLGYVRNSQLNIEKGSWQDGYIRSGYIRALEALFHGAVPKGYEPPY